MDSPQSPNDTAASPQPERQWVWRATLESRAAGKVSVLAVGETVFAVVLYWWIAIRWETHWHLVTSVFIAPLLLLRSPESIAAGVRWFVKDWFGFESYQQWPKAKQRALRVLISVVSAVVGYFFVWWFSGVVMLETWTGWSLFSCLATIGVATVSVATAATIAAMGAIKGAVVVSEEGLCFRTPSGPIFSVIASALVGLSAGAVAVVVRVADTVPVVSLLGGALASIPLGGVAGYGAGLSLRAVLFRIGATVRFAHCGLTRVPGNWRESNLITDVCVPAEFLPGIRNHQAELTLDGWLTAVRMEDTQLTSVRFIGYFMIPFLFLPAFLYRLNIKATAWFWWPLAFLLRPVKQPTVAEDQKEALCWPWTNPFQKLLFVGISLLAMTVLFVRHMDPVRWSRLSKVEGVWTPVKALLALDWLHFPPWHWAIFVSAGCGIVMLALAGGAVSCSTNKKWPPPGLGWKVKAMESLVRIRSLATVALLLFSLGALFIAHTPWHTHVPLPVSWYSAMKRFYRVADSAEGGRAHPASR